MFATAASAFGAARRDATIALGGGPTAEVDVGESFDAEEAVTAACGIGGEASAAACAFSIENDAGQAGDAAFVASADEAECAAADVVDTILSGGAGATASAVDFGRSAGVVEAAQTRAALVVSGACFGNASALSAKDAASFGGTATIVACVNLFAALFDAFLGREAVAVLGACLSAACGADAAEADFTACTLLVACTGGSGLTEVGGAAVSRRAVGVGATAFFAAEAEFAAVFGFAVGVGGARGAAFIFADASCGAFSGGFARFGACFLGAQTDGVVGVFDGDATITRGASAVGSGATEEAAFFFLGVASEFKLAGGLVVAIHTFFSAVVWGDTEALCVVGSFGDDAAEVSFAARSERIARCATTCAAARVDALEVSAASLLCGASDPFVGAGLVVDAISADAFEGFEAIVVVAAARVGLCASAGIERRCAVASKDDLWIVGVSDGGAVVSGGAGSTVGAIEATAVSVGEADTKVFGADAIVVVVAGLADFLVGCATLGVSAIVADEVGAAGFGIFATRLCGVEIADALTVVIGDLALAGFARVGGSKHGCGDDLGVSKGQDMAEFVGEDGLEVVFVVGSDADGNDLCVPIVHGDIGVQHLAIAGVVVGFGACEFDVTEFPVGFLRDEFDHELSVIRGG